MPTLPSIESDALRAHYQATSKILADNPGLDLTLMRALLEDIHSCAAEPVGVTYEEVSAGGRPALWCIPQNNAHDRAVLYLHGGGFVLQSINSHRKLAGHLARAIGARVLLIDFRKAPEHPHPAQLHDSESAYNWLLGEGFDPRHIAIAGDSAGACLAITTTVRLRDTDTPLPAAIVGFSPWFDLECTGSTLESNAGVDALVQRELVEGMAALYLGPAGSAVDPTANPLHTDLSGLPPVYLSAGSHETLLDNSERFSNRALSVGVDVTVEVSPGQQHVHTFMAGRAPEADQTIAAAGAWTRTRLGLGPLTLQEAAAASQQPS